MGEKPRNLRSFRDMAPAAEAGCYAVGSFSPRYPLMIPPVLQAAQELASPLLVQISEKDMNRCEVSVEEFAEAFYGYLAQLQVTVPVCLHLDHTHRVDLIERALRAGYTSVMIDASELPLEENIRVTSEVVAKAHALGVSVEAELGTIGAFAFAETEASELVEYTDPGKVPGFVEATGIDALAVSVGTIHGVDASRPVAIDTDRLAAIRAVTDVHLVLHGGSGIDAREMHRAIDIPGGGVSKVNLATDLELAMLEAIGSDHRMVNSEIVALPGPRLHDAQRAVEGVVRTKIRDVLRSEAKAATSLRGSA